MKFSLSSNLNWSKSINFENGSNSYIMPVYSRRSIIFILHHFLSFYFHYHRRNQLTILQAQFHKHNSWMHNCTYDIVYRWLCTHKWTKLIQLRFLQDQSLSNFLIILFPFYITICVYIEKFCWELYITVFVMQKLPSYRAKMKVFLKMNTIIRKGI